MKEAVSFRVRKSSFYDKKSDAPFKISRSKLIIKDFIIEFEKLDSLNKETIEVLINSLIGKHKTNFKGVGQPLRIGLVGSRFGPGLYDVILSLNKTEVIKRLGKI